MSAVRARQRPPLSDNESETENNLSPRKTLESAWSGQDGNARSKANREIEKENPDPRFAPKTIQDWTRIGHFISVTEAAQLAGVSSKTITRWCESGKLIAMKRPYADRVTYDILRPALEDVLKSFAEKDARRQKITKRQDVQHSEYVSAWKEEMKKGGIYRKPLSSSILRDYPYHIETLLSRHKILSFATVEMELLSISPEQFGKKDKFYKAVVNFAKFLEKEEAIESDFLREIKALKPKRHKDPIRHTISEDDVRKLLAVCETPLETLIITLLATTGVRASEACSIQGRHILFKDRKLIIEHGKGGKTREVGINRQLAKALVIYIKSLPLPLRKGYLLKNSLGQRMNKDGIYKRVTRLGKKAGVTVHPHACRRGFVTIFHRKGQPLKYLQQACGHSSILTTESYCRTTQQEVVDSMRDWTLDL